MSARARLIEKARGADAAPARLAAASGPHASAGTGPTRLQQASAEPGTIGPTRLDARGSGRVAPDGPRRAGAVAGPAPSPGFAGVSPAAPSAPLPFVLLAVFVIVLYTRPQDVVGALEPLRLAFLTGFGAAALHAMEAMRRGDPVVRIDRETRLLFAFVALAAASVPLGLWPGGSVALLKDQLFKVVLVFVLIAHLADSAARIRALVGLLVAAGVYLALGSLYLLATGQATRYLGRGQGLVGGMFKDPNDLALALVIMTALAGFQLLAARRMLVRALYGAAIVVMLAGVMATYSRGGLVALLAAGAVGLRRVATRGMAPAVFGVAALGLVGIAVMPSGYSERATSIVTQDGDTGSIDARMTTLRHGLQIMAENPVVGVGIGNFRIAEGEKHAGVGKWNEAHNAFIQVGAEMGWAGLAVYLALAFCAVANARAAARAVAGDPGLSAIAHGLETALVGFLVGALFLSQAYTWHFYILLGLTVALRQLAERHRRSAPAQAAEPARPAGGPVRLARPAVPSAEGRS
jgi:O-antigen ligase